jgi:PleD family two-component response regulator
VNGYEVCQIIKDNPKTQQIPVIFLSALSHQEALRKAAEGGVDDFILKPCTPERLIKHVERQLAQRRLGSDENKEGK